MWIIDPKKWRELYNRLTSDLEPYWHYDDGYRDAMDYVDDWLEDQPELMAKGGVPMFEELCKEMTLRQDAENPDTMWLCVAGIRIIFRDGKYVGWYKP